MFLIESALPEDSLKKLSKKEITALNESIGKEIDARTSSLDAEMRSKFDVMVEGFTDRFNNYVNDAVLESVNNATSNKINQKTLTILHGILNLLESSGITVTEKTTELQEKLKEANRNLEKAFAEVEGIQKALDESNKERLILAKLKGMNPNIVNHALEYFKNKDILDVQEEIESFMNGDFSNLVNSDEEMLDGLENLDLDKVKDAIENLESDRNQKNLTKSTIKFESVQSNLAPVKVLKGTRMQNITEGDLSKPAGFAKPLFESAEVEGNDEEVESDNDVQDAMDKTNELGNMGFGKKV